MGNTFLVGVGPKISVKVIDMIAANGGELCGGQFPCCVGRKVGSTAPSPIVDRLPPVATARNPNRRVIAEIVGKGNASPCPGKHRNRNVYIEITEIKNVRPATKGTERTRASRNLCRRCPRTRTANNTTQRDESFIFSLLCSDESCLLKLRNKLCEDTVDVNGKPQWKSDQECPDFGQSK